MTADEPVGRGASDTTPASSDMSSNTAAVSDATGATTKPANMTNATPGAPSEVETNTPSDGDIGTTPGNVAAVFIISAIFSPVDPIFRCKKPLQQL